MFKRLVIIYLIIGSLNVYNLSVLGNISKLVGISAMALMAVILVVNQVYFKVPLIKQHFKAPIFLMIAAVFLSMFTAYVAFNQNFAISFYAQRDIYFYMFYFTLHVLKVDKRDLQRIIILFGLLFFFLYLIQYFAFPTQLFDVGMREERGTIRIYLEGSGYAMLSYFMCLHIYYSTNKVKYLLLSIVFLIPIILFGARSGLFTLLMGTIAQLLFSKRLKSKVLIVFLVLVALVPTFYFFQGVFEGLARATETESAEGTDNVRILAAQYFLTQFIPNDFAYLSGIGAPSDRSPLGQMTTLLTKNYGFYLVDIGIIGNYVTYGVGFIAGIVWIVIRYLSLGVRNDLIYLKYFFIFMVLLLLPIAAGFAFSPPIAIITCTLYLMDVSNHERRLFEA